MLNFLAKKLDFGKGLGRVGERSNRKRDLVPLEVGPSSLVKVAPLEKRVAVEGDV